MNVEQLKSGSVEAWTWLIRQQRNMADEIVIGVQSESINSGQTRYLLTLSNYSEPISLIGNDTNHTEFAFYSQYAAGSNRVAPDSWFNWFDQEGGWVVTEENGPYHPPSTWSRQDLEHVIEKLARFHGQWWDNNIQSADLPKHPVIESYIHIEQVQAQSKQQSSKGRFGIKQAKPKQNIPPVVETAQPFGAAVPELMLASVGFKMLKKLGGLPDVIEAVHMNALDNLLQHPEIMLKHLHHVPLTLVHGQPVAENWRINLNDEVRLVNWRQASIGPSICDLASFIESYIFWHTPRPDSHRLVHGSLEELLVDHYFMTLGERVSLEGENRPGSSRYLRRYALPAAICWQTVSHWLPTFADWFNHLPQSRHTWEMFDEMKLDNLNNWGMQNLNQYRPAIGAIFERFLEAYKLLATD
ncbi:MAG: hypothetical protein AAGD96_06450 [Chloroflexota bacterium]